MSSESFVSKPSLVLWVSAATALLHALSGGLVIGYHAAAIDSMVKNIPEVAWTDSTKSWVASTFAIGALTGSLFAGPTVTTLGPRLSLMVNSVPFLVGWLLLIFGKSLWLIIPGRLLGGLSLGFSTGSVPVYVLEISTEGLRGPFGVAFQMLINAGILFAYVLGYYLEYQAVGAISAVFALAMPFIMFMCPESPSFLNAKHGSTGRDLVTGSLARLRSPDSDIAAEYDEMTKDGPSEPQPKILGFDQIKQRNVWKPLLAACGLSFFQQFTGNNAVIFYQNEIYATSGFSLDPRICSMITGSVLVASTLLGTVLIKRFGRKSLLNASALGMVITLLVLGAYFWRLDVLTKSDPAAATALSANWGWLCLVALMAFLGVFSFGYGPIVWLLIPEITPYFARNFVTSVGTCFNWFLVFLVTNLFPAFTQHFGTEAGFFFFALWAVVAIFFVHFFLP
ncbi:Facilitated trehalose transporter Tret1 [Halotydeus destructor]|nr:Facilitated trehalose transporter Tret1 [Halotydeus destructor]